MTGSSEASERLRNWHVTGNWDDLWPDLPAPQRLSALAKIRAVVEAVLAGSPRPPRLTAENEREARSIGVAAFTAGLGPLLAHWIDAGLVEAAPPAQDVLSKHLEQGARRIALLRSHAVEMVRRMRAVGVDPILLKGMHTGAEFFPHPSTRPASDIDFLVRPAEVPKAAAALTDLGFTETSRTMFANRSTWTHAGASRVVRSIEMDTADNPWTVDLHRALERWYFRGTRRDLGSRAFDTTRTVSFEGESIRVLDEPYLTAFLALHTSNHFRVMQLVRLLELAWVIREDRRTGRLDVGALDSLLRNTGTGRFVYPALALAEDLAPGTVDGALLRRLATQVSQRMHRVLAKIRRAEMGALNERSSDVLLAWAVGPRELLLNSLEIVAPSDDLVGGWRVALRRRVGMVARSVPRGDRGT